MTRRRIRAAAKRRMQLAATMALVLAAAGRLAAEAPLVIRYPWSDLPEWVDVRAATGGDGNLAFGDWDDPVWEQLFDRIAASTGEAVDVDIYWIDRVESRGYSTFEESIRSAAFVARGRVAGRTYGFRGGEPGQLLEVAPDAVLKGSWRGGSLFAFYPVATFCAGGRLLRKTDDRWPEPPPEGAEVFLFSQVPPRETGWVEGESDGDVLVVGGDGNFVFGRYAGPLERASDARDPLELDSLTRTVLDSREQRLKDARDPGGAPDLLYESSNIFPEWVDSRVAFEPGRGIDGGLFRPDWADRLRGLLAASRADGAVRVGEVDPPSKAVPDPPTLGDAVRRAVVASLVRVSGRTTGFWRGIPGTLLRLERERDFRGLFGDFESYLFVPVGDFDLAGTRIVKRDRRYPPVPADGEEAFLFTTPWPRSEIFAPQTGAGFVAVAPDGRLLMGPDVPRDPSIGTKGALIDAILSAPAPSS
jgi:hypothetical protein